MMSTHSNHSNAAEFMIQRIYATVSSEVPNVPEVFEVAKSPELDIKLNVQNKASNSHVGNCVVELTVVVTAIQDKKTLFLVEVKQGGIFTVQGFDEATNEQIINVQCPAMLYPYAGALASDLILRAGFMPVHLPPVDFAAMYEHKKRDTST